MSWKSTEMIEKALLINMLIIFCCELPLWVSGMVYAKSTFRSGVKDYSIIKKTCTVRIKNGPSIKEDVL